jgi:hypothetical protein
MTVEEFVQSLVLIIVLLATGIVLPVGLVAVSGSSDSEVRPAGAGPVFVFEQVR